MLNKKTIATVAVAAAVIGGGAALTPAATALSGCSGISGGASRAWTGGYCDESNYLQTTSTSSRNVSWVGSFFNDNISSVEVGVKTSGWKGWKNANYDGCSIRLGPGEWHLGWLLWGNCGGDPNNEISSMKLFAY